MAIHANIYPLWADEAQYWQWSHALDSGYFSKPPMIAWLIAFGTHFQGDTTLGIRLMAPICHTIVAWLLFLTAHQLYDQRTAWWTGILYLTLPAVVLNSYFISADTPLLVMWALALYALVRIEQNNTATLWWLVLGFALGMGMLSKYTMAAFAITLVALMVFQPAKRGWWAEWRAWLAAVVAILIFLPNLLWNLHHQFVSFSHTENNTFSKGFDLLPLDMLAFTGGQAGVIGPVLFIVFLWCAARHRHMSHTTHYPLLVWFTLPLLLVAIIISLLSGAQAHWAAPAYLAGMIWISHAVLHHLRPVLRSIVLTFCLLLSLSITSLFYSMPTLLKQYDIPFKPHARLHIWHGLATEISPFLHQYPNTLLAVDERKALAALTFDLRAEDGTPYPVKKWNDEGDIDDHYDMVASIAVYPNQPVLFLTRSKELREITPYAGHITLLKQFTIHDETFTLYLLQPFTGFHP